MSTLPPNPVPSLPDKLITTFNVAATTAATYLKSHLPVATVASALLLLGLGYLLYKILIDD